MDCAGELCCGVLGDGLMEEHEGDGLPTTNVPFTLGTGATDPFKRKRSVIRFLKFWVITVY